MSSPDDSPSIKQADQVRRTLFKRPLFIVLFLLGTLMAYSLFLIVMFHERVAFFQKHGAHLETEFRNSRGELIRGGYENALGKAFIPGPLLRYQRSIDGVHLARSAQLSDSEIDQLFQQLTNFPQLKWLTLEGFHINEPRARALARLTKLEDLALRFCTIDETCLATLLGQNGLQHVSLANSKFDESELAIFHQQPAQKTLRSLSLSNCQVTDQTAKLIAGCNQLAFLELDGTRISDQGVKILARLPRLEVLILDHTNVTDAGVAYLSGTPQLVELSLSNTDASDEMLESLQLEIPALRVSDD